MIAHQENRVAEMAPARLAEKKLLVVEDDSLIALDMIACLEEAGAEMAGPVGTVREALQVIESGSFDGAPLDGNLRDKKVDDIAIALTRRNIPFLFVSGYGRERLPSAFRSAQVVSKPFTSTDLVEAAARLVRSGQ